MVIALDPTDIAAEQYKRYEESIDNSAKAGFTAILGHFNILWSSSKITCFFKQESLLTVVIGKIVVRFNKNFRYSYC